MCGGWGAGGWAAGPGGVPRCRVEQVVAGSPAEECGLIGSGHELLAVDGGPLIGRGIDAIAEMIMGPVGSAVCVCLRDPTPPDGGGGDSSSGGGGATEYQVTLRRELALDLLDDDDSDSESERMVSEGHGGAGARAGPGELRHHTHHHDAEDDDEVDDEDDFDLFGGGMASTGLGGGGGGGGGGPSRERAAATTVAGPWSVAQPCVVEALSAELRAREAREASEAPALDAMQAELALIAAQVERFRNLLLAREHEVRVRSFALSLLPPPLPKQ